MSVVFVKVADPNTGRFERVDLGRFAHFAGRFEITQLVRIDQTGVIVNGEVSVVKQIVDGRRTAQFEVKLVVFLKQRTTVYRYRYGNV